MEMEMEDLLWMLGLASPLFLVAWVVDKTTLPWLDRKLEGRKIKLGPWEIAKQDLFFLGSKWFLRTRTRSYELNLDTVWTIFVFTVFGLAAIGLLIAYA
jgi:hypothetical protein